MLKEEKKQLLMLANKNLENKEKDQLIKSAVNQKKEPRSQISSQIGASSKDKAQKSQNSLLFQENHEEPDLTPGRPKAIPNLPKSSAKKFQVQNSHQATQIQIQSPQGLIEGDHQKFDSKNSSS